MAVSSLVFWALILTIEWSSEAVMSYSKTKQADLPVPYSALFDEGLSWISNVISLQFSKSEKECLQKQSVFYENSLHCYNLLTDGPCNDSQWLVFSKEAFVNSGQLRTVCSDRPCELPEERLGEAVAKCDDDQVKANLDAPDGLNSGNCRFIGKNAFGERKCLCHGFKFRLLESNNDMCYLAYERGLCDEGSVITPTYDLLQVDAAECRPDPCFSKSNNATLRMIPVLLDNGETECYELGTQGPCPSNRNLGFGFYSGLPYYYPTCSFTLPSSIKLSSKNYYTKHESSGNKGVYKETAQINPLY